MPQRIEVPGMGIVEFPDGMSDDQIAQAIQQNMQPQKPEMPMAQRVLGNLAGGLVRGAGSIGATLLTPIDKALGNTKSWGNPERRKAMDEALASLGFDTESLSFGAGKLGAEVAGTMGVGGVAAAPLRGIQSIRPVVDALATSGFSAGGLTGARGLAARTLGGGVTGAGAAALVNPEDADTGAAIGAALPGALRLAGKAGHAVGSSFKGGKKRAAEKLIEALELDPAVLAQRLATSREIVPGSAPTLGQVLQTPQASILERTVSQSPGGALLRQRYADQNAARLAALDAIESIDPRGLRTIQDDFGASALSAIRSGDEVARAETRAAYQAVPQDEAALYLPDLAGVADKYFPPGAFGGRSAVDAAVRTAGDIGSAEVAGIVPTRARPAESLATAVRRAGGVSRGSLAGEVDGLAGQHKNMVRNRGRTLDDLAETMAERGFIGDESADSLIEALNAEARGRAVYAADTPDGVFAAMRDAQMGDAPGAQMVPQKVTLRQFDALRKSIGNAQRAAARDPERATEAAALAEMKRSLDDRINEVVRGDGAIDENLPIAWADQLTEAQRLKRQQVEKFRTGPQAEAFRTGNDGMPKVQGGEFARYAWSNRSGAAADIRQLRKAIEDHPEVMRQFRSMVTTEGASTVTAGGDLTGKFVRWVDNALPGLKEVFSADQVKAMQRIADDIKRSETANALGAVKGSDTFQKSAQALDVGLLDNPLVNMAANRIPLIGQFTGPMLDGLRQNARRTLATDMAGLLASPSEAANAIGLLSSEPAPWWTLTQQGLLRAAPVAAANP